MSSPTLRQRLFATEYLVDFNATQAAIRAGYSPRSAHVSGGRLLKYDSVAKLIDEAIDKALGTQREQIRFRVLKELQEIAFADITEDVQVVTRTITPPARDTDGDDPAEPQEYQVVTFVDTKDSKNRKAIASIKQNEKGVIEIKYHDKTKALELLGKYGALFTDQLEIRTPDGLRVDHSTLTEEEAEELFRRRIAE